MAKPEVRILENLDELARETADLVLWLAQEAISTDGRFSIALAGGSTPRALYVALAASPLARQLDWSTVWVFFSDERCVPPDHQDSNFRLANEHLLQPLKIPEAHIFRLEGERDPEEAARRYERAVLDHVRVSAPAVPRFHLILLGLGEDGHTASLFPGTSALKEETRLITPSQAPAGVRHRLTFTLPLINAASTVLFLVTGRGKAGVVRSILEPDPQAGERLPASRVQPRSGRLIWCLDTEAASLLSATRRQVTSHEE